MSIITDALRKAEEERGRKTKQTVEQVLVQADLEQEELLKRFGYATKPNTAETVLPPESLQIKPPANVFISIIQKTLVSVSLISICFLVVYLGPRWLLNPGSFSEDWASFENSAASKIDFLIPGLMPHNRSVISVQETALIPSQGIIGEESPVSASGATEGSVPVSALPKEPESAYVLSGISVMGSSRYAVVNDSIVQKGDSIDGAYVKEILDREVVLETRSAEIKLKIPS